MTRILYLADGPLPNPEPNETLHREPDGQPYDRIITFAFITQCFWTELPDKTRALLEHLAPGGELHFYEPSAEYTAREFLSNRISPVLFFHAYGDPDHPHHMGTNLLMLRALLKDLGLIEGKAVTRPYPIAHSPEGEPYFTDVHWVVGIKGNGAQLGRPKEWLG